MFSYVELRDRQLCKEEICAVACIMNPQKGVLHNFIEVYLEGENPDGHSKTLKNGYPQPGEIICPF